MAGRAQPRGAALPLAVLGEGSDRRGRRARVALELAARAVDDATATRIQQKLKGAGNKTPIGKLLKKYDKSGDGKLDKRELAQLKRAGGSELGGSVFYSCASQLKAIIAEKMGPVQELIDLATMQAVDGSPAFERGLMTSLQATNPAAETGGHLPMGGSGSGRIILRHY